MNVLITGGYGFIGSHVAERFSAAGDRIYIIDDLSSGKKVNFIRKHRFYQLGVENRKCEEIFRSVRFDIVIHLAAQISVSCSMRNSYRDTESNLLGLVNMLELSVKYGVKRFIFASSAAVYGNNEILPLTEEAAAEPLSPYGMSKLTGEYYCRKWNELFGLETLCLRFANVYGPRQGISGEGGVVSVFADRIVKGQELEVFGDGRQTRDFIYVKDIAEAIYRASAIKYNGILNLSSNSECSINHLVEILCGLCGIKGVIYGKAREGDIGRSCMNNEKIRQLLNWSPMYTMEKGLEETYQWFEENNRDRGGNSTGNATKAQRKKNKEGRKSIRKLLMPYFENLLGIGAVSVLTYFTQNLDNYYVIDYRLVYIILIGTVYGLRQGIISGILSCGLFAFLFFESGRDAISILFDPVSLLQLAVYMLAGSVAGYYSDKRNAEETELVGKLNLSEEKYVFLNEVYKDTLEVKEELSVQVANSRDSMGRLYSIIKRLDGLDSGEIFSRSISVFEELAGTDEVSIYLMGECNKYAILKCKSSKKGFDVPQVLRVDDRPDIKYVLQNSDIHVNREFIAALPLMTAPVIDRGRVAAIILIHNTSYENLTLHRYNQFRLALEMLSASVSRANTHQEALRNCDYVER